MICTIVIALFSIAAVAYLFYMIFDEKARQILFSKEYTRNKFVAAQKKANFFRTVATVAACIPVTGGLLYGIWFIWYYLCAGMVILKAFDSFFGFICGFILSVIMLLYFLKGISMLFRN